MDAASLTPGALIREGLRDVVRPPFLGLLLFSLFVFVVEDSITAAGDELSLAFGLALAALSAFIQIACTLAAGAADPARSADTWFVAGVRRRCFWRFIGAELAMLLLIALGAVFLVVGAFIAGALVALAQPAAVLERRAPVQAVRRSVELGRGARGRLGVVFAVLVLIPGAALQAAYYFDVDNAVGAPFLLASLTAVLLALTATISLTRAFVRLGGKPTPEGGAADEGPARDAARHRE